jgi:hypothetical protein
MEQFPSMGEKSPVSEEMIQGRIIPDVVKNLRRFDKSIQGDMKQDVLSSLGSMPTDQAEEVWERAFEIAQSEDQDAMLEKDRQERIAVAKNNESMLRKKI